MCGWLWCRRSSGGARRAWAGGLRAPNLPCPAPHHAQTADPTSSCLAHMKDNIPMYNLSKLYTCTYDRLREWSHATLAKMSRQNWLHAITILVTMRATVNIFGFWWERQFGNRWSKPCNKFDSCILLLKANFWYLCTKQGAEKHSGKYNFLQFIWFENQTCKEE